MVVRFLPVLAAVAVALALEAEPVAIRYPGEWRIKTKYVIPVKRIGVHDMELYVNERACTRMNVRVPQVTTLFPVSAE